MKENECSRSAHLLTSANIACPSRCHLSTSSSESGFLELTRVLASRRMFACHHCGGDTRCLTENLREGFQLGHILAAFPTVYLSKIMRSERTASRCSVCTGQLGSRMIQIPQRVSTTTEEFLRLLDRSLCGWRSKEPHSARNRR